MNRTLVLGTAALLGLAFAGRATAAENHDYWDHQWSGTSTWDAPYATPDQDADWESGVDNHDLSWQDKNFLDTASRINQEEITLAATAQTNAQDPDIKSFAQQMQTAHQNAEDALTRLADHLGYTLPTGLTAGQQADVTRLGQLQGNYFDHAYRYAMVGGHQDAVAYAIRESAQGRNPRVIHFADWSIGHFRNHLMMAQGLTDTWTYYNAPQPLLSSPTYMTPNSTTIPGSAPTTEGAAPTILNNGNLPTPPAAPAGAIPTPVTGTNQ
jgi:putative membrane protein